MRVTDVDTDALVRVFSGLDWPDIGELCQAALSGGVFSSNFFSKCVNQHAKATLRRLLRSGKLKDSNGVTIKVASIFIKDRATGKKKRVYKREDEFSESDFVQVMLYHKGLAKIHVKKLRYYKKAAIKKFGEQIQGMLPGFDDIVGPGDVGS